MRGISPFGTCYSYIHILRIYTGRHAGVYSQTPQKFKGRGQPARRKSGHGEGATEDAAYLNSDSGPFVGSGASRRRWCRFSGSMTPNTLMACRRIYLQVRPASNRECRSGAANLLGWLILLSPEFKIGVEEEVDQDDWGSLSQHLAVCTRPVMTDLRWSRAAHTWCPLPTSANGWLGVCGACTFSRAEAAAAD